MLVLVYAVVTIMVFLTFRNLKAVVCIMVPLSITSMLCEAVMAHLGIGIKVATLPVIALGVGIGVDYGIYIYSRMEHYLLLGYGTSEAYKHTLRSAGRAVTLTGLTLLPALAVILFGEQHEAVEPDQDGLSKADSAALRQNKPVTGIGGETVNATG